MITGQGTKIPHAVWHCQKTKSKHPHKQQEQHKRLTGMNLGRIRTGKIGGVRTQKRSLLCSPRPEW